MTATYNNSIVVQFDTEANGNAGSLKPVTVFNAGTTNKASLTDLIGTPIDNPVIADISGNYTFNAADGFYDIFIDYGLATQVPMLNQLIGEQEVDIQLINDLSQTYEFPTRQLMIDSVIEFPDKKRLYVKDIKAGYIVTTGSTVEPQGSPDLTGGGYAKLQILNNIYNITHYNAIDGAPDNTNQMRAAMEEAALTGGTYYVPSGLWIHEQIDWRSGVTGRGDGETSIDQRLSDPANPTTTKVSYRFFNSDTVPPYDRAFNIRNLDIQGINFKGTVVDDGFMEQKHLFLIQGGTDILITRCWFEGWQGDAIVIRSGNATAAAQNENIRIFNNHFNGVNKNNRNAITYNDCSGLWIMFNKFVNCTRDGDAAYVGGAYDIMDPNAGPPMPGAIDCEPNVADTFVVIKNINILYNNFDNIGGNIAAIAVFLPVPEGDYTNGDPQDWNIVGNNFDNVIKYLQISQTQTADVTDSSHNSNYKVTLNSGKNASERPFWLYGVKGIDMYKNKWEESANTCRVGWLPGFPFRGVRDVKIKDTFKHCGTVDGIAVSIYESDRVDIESTFDNCGITGGGFGVAVSIPDTTTSSLIKLNKNVILNNEGLMTAAVTVVGTLTPGGNEAIGNDWGGLDSSSFVAELTTFGESTSDIAITALAGGQAGAYQLTAAMNIVSGGASFDGVKLPTSEGDARVITINNRAAVSIQVFPSSNDDLGQGVNMPESIAAGLSKTYKSVDTINWIKTTS